MLVLPSVKVTVPVGEPAPGVTTFTVALINTAEPNTDGFTDDVNDNTVPS